MSIIVGSIIILFKAFLCGLFTSLLGFLIVRTIVPLKLIPNIVICVVFVFLYLFQFSLWFSALKAEEYMIITESTLSSNYTSEILTNNPWLEQIVQENSACSFAIFEIQSLQNTIDSYKARRMLWLAFFFLAEIFMCFIFRKQSERNFNVPTHNKYYTQGNVKF